MLVDSDRIVAVPRQCGADLAAFEQHMAGIQQPTFPYAITGDTASLPSRGLTPTQATSSENRKGQIADFAPAPN